jgi:hypothetical protein
VPTYERNIHATEVAGRDAIFGHMAPQCADCSARFIPWLVQESGASRPAFLGYGVSENSKVCAETYAASVEMYADEIGLDEVAYLNSDLAFGLPNGVGPEVTAMKDAGVDFIATCMDLNGMKTLGQELQRQGMDDVVMYHPNSYNQDFVAENADIFEGDWVLPQFVPFEYDTGLEAQQEFLAWMDATGSELSELAMIGWINADQAFKALLAAGPEFDRQAVIDAANEMTEFSAGGLINPIDWTRQHNPPTEGDPANDYAQECVAVVRIEGGVFVPVTGDETKPWLCWSNENLDYGEPVETSFGATD